MQRLGARDTPPFQQAGRACAKVLLGGGMHPLFPSPSLLLPLFPWFPLHAADRAVLRKGKSGRATAVPRTLWCVRVKCRMPTVASSPSDAHHCLLPPLHLPLLSPSPYCSSALATQAALPVPVPETPTQALHRSLPGLLQVCAQIPSLGKLPQTQFNPATHPIHPLPIPPVVSW